MKLKYLKRASLTSTAIAIMLAMSSSVVAQEMHENGAQYPLGYIAGELIEPIPFCEVINIIGGASEEEVEMVVGPGAGALGQIFDAIELGEGGDLLPLYQMKCLAAQPPR